MPGEDISSIIATVLSFGYYFFIAFSSLCRLKTFQLVYFDEKNLQAAIHFAKVFSALGFLFCPLCAIGGQLSLLFM